MNCHEFEAKLHLLADPASPVFLRQAGEAHAAGCPRCRRLRAIAAGDVDPFDPGAAEELTASILQGTSGSICDRIDGPKCAWVDGVLPEGDAGLLLEHLERCSGCRSTVAALMELRETLPLLAEITPDARFVRDVLDRTVRARRRDPGPLETVDGWLSQLSRRPRLAQEIAYVAAMLLFLLFGPLPERPGRADPADSGAARTPSMSAISSLGQGVQAVSDLADDVAAVIGDLAARRPEEDLPSRAAGFARTVARVDKSAKWLAKDGNRAASALIRLDTVEIWSAFVECRDGIRDCWKSSEPTEPSAIPLRSPDQARQPQDQRRLEEGTDHDHEARGDDAE